MYPFDTTTQLRRVSTDHEVPVYFPARTDRTILPISTTKLGTGRGHNSQRRQHSRHRWSAFPMMEG